MTGVLLVALMLLLPAHSGDPLTLEVLKERVERMAQQLNATAIAAPPASHTPPKASSAGRASTLRCSPMLSPLPFSPSRLLRASRLLSEEPFLPCVATAQGLAPPFSTARSDCEPSSGPPAMRELLAALPCISHTVQPATRHPHDTNYFGVQTPCAIDASAATWSSLSSPSSLALHSVLSSSFSSSLSSPLLHSCAARESPVKGLPFDPSLRQMGAWSSRAFHWLAVAAVAQSSAGGDFVYAELGGAGSEAAELSASAFWIAQYLRPERPFRLVGLQTDPLRCRAAARGLALAGVDLQQHEYHCASLGPVEGLGREGRPETTVAALLGHLPAVDVVDLALPEDGGDVAALLQLDAWLFFQRVRTLLVKTRSFDAHQRVLAVLSSWGWTPVFAFAPSPSSPSRTPLGHFRFPLGVQFWCNPLFNPHFKNSAPFRAFLSLFPPASSLPPLPSAESAAAASSAAALATPPAAVVKKKWPGLEDWLGALGLENRFQIEYLGKFLRNHIDTFQLLSSLTSEQLKSDIGISSLGHRLLILGSFPLFTP